MKNKIQFYFLDMVAIGLFVASILNVLAGIHPAAVLNQADSILSLSHRMVLFIVAAIELVFSGILSFQRNPMRRLALIMWLSFSLLTYRIGLWWSGDFVFGDCWGNLYYWFTLSPRFLNIVDNSLLTTSLAISAFFLIHNWSSLRSYKKKSVAYAAESAQK